MHYAPCICLSVPCLSLAFTECAYLGYTLRMKTWLTSYGSWHAYEKTKKTECAKDSIIVHDAFPVSTQRHLQLQLPSLEMLSLGKQMMSPADRIQKEQDPGLATICHHPDRRLSSCWSGSNGKTSIREIKWMWWHTIEQFNWRHPAAAMASLQQQACCVRLCILSGRQSHYDLGHQRGHHACIKVRQYFLQGNKIMK